MNSLKRRGRIGVVILEYGVHGSYTYLRYSKYLLLHESPKILDIMLRRKQCVPGISSGGQVTWEEWGRKGRRELMHGYKFLAMIYVCVSLKTTENTSTNNCLLNQALQHQCCISQAFSLWPSHHTQHLVVTCIFSPDRGKFTGAGGSLGWCNYGLLTFLSGLVEVLSFPGSCITFSLYVSFTFNPYSLFCLVPSSSEDPAILATPPSCPLVPWWLLTGVQL